MAAWNHVYAAIDFSKHKEQIMLLIYKSDPLDANIK